jgi:hypothetical protein
MPHDAWPSIFSAIQAFGLEFSHSDVAPASHGAAVAAGDGEGDDHAVADLEVAHAGPTSTTSPMNSWPRMSPGSMSGRKPL